MSCVAGHQPNLYPYGGFFAKAASVDKFVIVDNTQYVKKQYQNRNRIRLLSGEVIWLSIPVRKSGRFGQLINESEIDNSQQWQRKHLGSLEKNYAKAPYFAEYMPAIEQLLSQEWELLCSFNIAFIRWAFDVLDIGCEVSVASALGVEGKASGLILDICRKTESDSYLHGKHSRDYVDFEFLSSHGIHNLIQDFSSVSYSQPAPGFEANLSILDWLFNCGPLTRELLLQSSTTTEA